MARNKKMTELEYLRKRCASMDGALSRFCDLHGCVPNKTEGETFLGKFREYLTNMAAEKRALGGK